jgi:hypothetical protein
MMICLEKQTDQQNEEMQKQDVETGRGKRANREIRQPVGKVRHVFQNRAAGAC